MPLPGGRCALPEQQDRHQEKTRPGKWRVAESACSHRTQRALEMAGIAAADVDLATSSPDDLFGSACQVQAIIGAKKALAFDLTAACSGFVVGLVTGAEFIRTGIYRNVLVIGADALSRYVDWRDRGTCILFGDGCGAVVLTQQQAEQPCSLLGSSMASNGLGQKHLNAMCCGEGMKALHETHASARGSFENISMSGQEVFKFAVRAVPTVVEAALADAGVSKDDVDWLVLHQANQHILDSAATRLGVPSDSVISNLAEYGNTSAASIPLALDEAVRANTIIPGNVVGPGPIFPRCFLGYRVVVHLPLLAKALRSKYCRSGNVVRLVSLGVLEF
ncbi:hypothetical protein WJX75_005644 [Coccomyxa subellipsoidea]|uniref:Uncharacterized protein n=1 Tax=Coccomyxa subellipsoidea TaxID=248742 RepID=A0ABR2Z3G3_9CHLO